MIGPVNTLQFIDSMTGRLADHDPDDMKLRDWVNRWHEQERHNTLRIPDNQDD